jgi:Mn2+/Fe2+ NRAMP family transporter
MDERAAKWRLLGPGLVVAATGVGAGDLVATLIAGARYGDALLWAAIAGAVVKLAMAEGVGRFTLATGRTLYDGWRGLPGGFGRVAAAYFGLYLVIWGFVYGAAGMTATALPLATLAAPLGPLAALITWFGGYKMVEWIIGWLVAIMFVTVVGLAVLVAPDIGQTLRGLVPLVPEGAGVYALGLIGGVGGTVTVAAYGYWIAAKGWTGPEWMEVMRLDNRVAYAATGVFVVAMLIVGAELLHAAGIALERGDRGLLDLGEVLSERFGPAVATVFLIGFLATAFSSVLGVWQGVSLMFADFYAHLLGRAGDPAVTGDRSLAARAYMLWLTFPPMLLLMLDRPFGLIVAYGVLGAVFMPFLAGTLLWLLNSEATPKPWRNGWVSNGLLATAALMFLVLAGIEVAGLFS